MAMYTNGMSQRDIEDTLKEVYGTEISQGLISRITDKILPEVNEWQNRPLQTVYPIIFSTESRLNRSRITKSCRNACTRDREKIWRARRILSSLRSPKTSSQASMRASVPTSKVVELRIF